MSTELNSPGYSFYYEQDDILFNNPQQAADYFAAKGLDPHVLDYGSIVTMELRMNRVRIYVDYENPEKIVAITRG